jgi:dipeptidyl aminopeptidase/acylaminoacyl peptidase
MKKLLICMVLCLFIPDIVFAEGNDDFKAAFIRAGDLWVKMDSMEMKLTTGENISYPKWSSDGSKIAYLKNNASQAELWIYHFKMNKHLKVGVGVGNNFQWSPKGNSLGFQVNETLYVSHITHSLMVDSKIKNFSWLPDGSGFITSVKESEGLDSDIILRKVLLNGGGGVFYRIPVNSDEYFVSTSGFKWSKDRKWISFLLIPTASLSADANTLCVLSSDGKVFQEVNEMLNDENWFNWAPSTVHMGYISGVGREATKNKKLTVLKVPSITKEVITPLGYADQEFVWLDNQTLFVSRVKESEWVDVEKRPLPSLFRLNLRAEEQLRLTTPLAKEGDFDPKVTRNRLVWIRTDRQTANVFVSPIRSFRERLWIKNIKVANSYYERWNWDEVFSLYE